VGSRGQARVRGITHNDEPKVTKPHMAFVINEDVGLKSKDGDLSPRIVVHKVETDLLNVAMDNLL
jgi:hypothetical protein